MKSTLSISSLSRQVLLREIRDYLMIALGMILYGIGWTVFLLPNDITTGGVPGIASIVFWATGFPVQYTYFLINAVLLMLALKILGFKFSIKTIFAVFTLTFFLSLIQELTAGMHLLQDQPFMACVLGASFCGSGIGIAFSSNGSTGGTDIIAAIINKYRDITLGRVMMICDMIIITSSYFVLKDWEKVVYGFVTLYVCSFVLDQIVNSARQSVQFFIISKKYQEIGKEINALHRGVTVIDATGLYTGQEQKMMFVLAKKRQSTTIFRIINDIDPTAFVSQSAVIGVYGEGFDHFKLKKSKDWEKVVYGFVTLYVCSFVLDQIVNSARQSVQFFIISKKYQEIGKEINALHRGVTVIDATGLYTGQEQKMMFVLAKKRQSTTIFRIINDIDPTAFVSQSAVIGVYGEGFDHFKLKKSK